MEGHVSSCSCKNKAKESALNMEYGMMGEDLGHGFPFSDEETVILRLSDLPKVTLLENHNQTFPCCHNHLLCTWYD